MTKTSVKFRKNRHKTVGGVARQGTYYIRRTEGRTEGRNAENYVPPLFFEKAGDNEGARVLTKLYIVYCEADLRLCFRIYKKPIFSQRG